MAVVTSCENREFVFSVLDWNYQLIAMEANALFAFEKIPPHWPPGHCKLFPVQY